MKLPSFIDNLIHKKEKEVEYFLSLLFTGEKIKAAVWKKEDQGEILGKAEKEASSNWQEVITAADTIISQASGDIPQEKIKKVIFGLPPSWTKENKIQEPYLSSLRKLTAELTLTPIGFIVNDEAIVHFLSKSEGTPATLILLAFREETFSLTLAKVGVIEGIKEGERKESLALCEEINKILVEDFSKVEVLPSKIILYNSGEDLEVIKQELISYPWLTKAKFLHFPKIEILENDFDLKALVASTAIEMGTKMEQEVEASSVETTSQEKKGENLLEKNEVLSIPETEKPETEETFGFVKDKDILEEIPPSMPDLTILDEKPVVPKAPVGRQVKEADYAVFPAVKKGPVIKQPSFKFKFPTIPKPNLNLEFLLRHKNLGLIITFAAICLLIITGFLYWQLPHAKVILLVSPKISEKEEEIIIDPNITISSLEKKKIPGKEVTVEEKGSKKVKTAGKKIVGEKAKGEVTIFNKTNYPKNFKAGSQLIEAHNLKFTLSDDVTVASQSSVESGGQKITTYGKSKVKVTAVVIGAESNLAVGTEFKIEDFSTDTYNAKNEATAFSGGLSREISVVSQSDQDKLYKSLSTELLDKAKADLANKASGGQKIIEQVLDYSVSEKKFDKKIEEETNELNLNLSLKVETLAYSTNDLDNIVVSLISKSIPDGYEYKKEEVEKEVKEVLIQKDKSVILKMTFLINLLPKIDLETVKKNLSGKSLKVASDYLNGIPNVVGFEAKITPKFPGIFYTFPRIADNIKVEVKRK